MLFLACVEWVLVGWIGCGCRLNIMLVSSRQMPEGMTFWQNVTFCKLLYTAVGAIMGFTS